MALVYPLSLPTTVGPSNITFRVLHATAVSRSPFSYQSQAQSYMGQRWGASVTLPGLRGDQGMDDWVAFLISLKGQFGTFLMGDPARSVGRGLLGGTPLVNGSNTAGQSAVSIKGATASQTGWIKAGDYIQIGTGLNSRLYKSLTDASSSSGGIVSVDIFPNLRATYADSTPIVKTNAKGLFRLATNDMSWDINESTNYGISFDCEEVV